MDPTVELPSVLVVDDDGALPSLVRLAIELDGSFSVCGEAHNGVDAIRLAEEACPDVVILDLGLPDLPGLAVLEAIRECSPTSRVVVFSGLGDDATRSAALAGGASRYVLKGGDVAVLVRTVADVHGAEPVYVRTLDAEPASVRSARHFASAICRRWERGMVVEAVELVVSELVTNAVVHARTACVLCLRLGDDGVRIEVTDGSPVSPAPREPDGQSEGGRGMYLVAASARAWGVDPDDRGKTVWAEIPL